MKQKLSLFLKLTFAFLAIYYLASSEKLDFSEVIQVLATPAWFFPAILLVGCNLFCNTLRWHSLLQGQGISIPLFSTVKINFIGLFFNTFLPSSVGGDVVKGYYVASFLSGKRTEAVTTVVLDRVLGLTTLSSLAIVGAILSLSFIQSHLALFPLLYGALFLFFSLVLFFFVSLSSKIYQKDIFKRILSILPFSGHCIRVYESIYAYRRGFRKLSLAFLISLIGQLFFILAFQFALFKLGNPFPLSLLLFLVPLGMLATVVPLFPGGVGIGQAAFFQLFAWSGATKAIGANAFTLMQLVNLGWNMLGILFYLQRKGRAALREGV